MENEVTLLEFFVLVATNALSVLIVFLYRKSKTVKLKKEISRLEVELRDSHAQILEQMQENVQLENKIAELEKMKTVSEKSTPVTDSRVPLKKDKAA